MKKVGDRMEMNIGMVSPQFTLLSSESWFLWIDFCLAHLLRAIVLRFIAHPEPHTVPQPAKSPIPIAEADAQAMISIEKVLSNATKILHDHHLVWFAHYEKGRLYQSMGHFDRAKVEFETVLAGKFPSEIVTKKDNGKVSLQVSRLVWN